MNQITPDISRQSDWFFGTIPENWRAIPLKHLCKQVALYGANISAEEYQPEGVRFIRTSDIRDDGMLKEGGVFLPMQKVSDYILSEGDFLISRSGTIGRAYVHRSEHGTCAYAGYLVRFVLRYPQTASWLFYITKSQNFQQWLDASAIEATIGNVNGEKYANLLVPVPSLLQQHIITDYLDRETAHLDDLVSVKEKLLELLKEKQRAVITRAVTRGLNPDVPLCDSGIPFLDEIPKHWDTVRLKHISTIYYGLSQPPEYVNDGLPFIRATNIKRGAVLHEGLVFVDEADLSANRVVRLREGDIIVVRSGAYTGDSALITGEWSGAIAGFDMVVRLCTEIVSSFVASTLLCPYVLEAQFDPLRMRAAQPHLNAEELGNIVLVLPPITEQQNIVAHIATKTAKLDALKLVTERTIALLKERRAALIAAAVTGKIKVV